MYKARNEKSKLRMSLYAFAALLILSAISLDVLGAEAAETTKAAGSEDLFELSLEQLMEVGVYAAATLTEKDPLKTPASVTTITAKDIAITPARNILDLIEIYVPGALYMNHSIGPTFGIRGFIGDRPYKYLINVNGMNVNIKAHYGARLELLNWELSDISRIEIVRGPGSVTYGPGAIGGVINIYTKKGKEAPGWEIGGHYWDKYDSVGNYVSYGRSKDQFDLYAYFSQVETKGTRPDLYGIDGITGGSGYVGADGGSAPGESRPPTTYMSDYFGQPQIKAHLDIHFNDEWRFWGRYVTSSFNLMQYNATKWLMSNGKYEDFRQTRHRYFQFALENSRTLSQNWDLKSTFGISSIDTHDIQKPYISTTEITYIDKESLECQKWTWSEWEYFARFMLNYKPEDGNIKAAIGYEISWDSIRPAWGKNKNNGLRMGDGGIMSGTSSDAYGSGGNLIDESSPKYYAAGNGWDTVTHSFLSELNITVTPKTTMIFSARVDKHSYTGYELSPRFALIQQLKQDEYLKFIMQRSVRMNTQEELWMNKKDGRENDPEELETFELIYSNKFTDRLSCQASAFLNKNDVIAWDGTTRGAAPIGLLRTFGTELELLYKKENFELGINHSYVKQLSWENADGVQRQGISYSDYYYDVGTEIHSHGSNLNNWSNHATKLFTNIDMFKKKVTLHGDVRVLWGFEGCKEGLEAVSQASENDVDFAAIDDVRNKNGYDLEATGNLSLTYHLDSFADVTMFIQNIPVIGENKRYGYSTGFKKLPPERVSWVEEPMVIGVRYKVRF